MKHRVLGISSLVSLLVVAAGVSAAPQSAFLRSCLRYDRALSASVSDTQQRNLLALSMATTESPTTDPIEMLSSYRQLSAGVVELLNSDTSANWQTNHWVDESRSTYTYDGANRLSVSVGETFDGVAWKNFIQMIMTYDGSGRPLTVTNKTWQGGSWVNSQKTTYSVFTADGFPTIEVMQFWTGSAWKDTMKTTYTYASGRMTSSVVQSWSGSAWVNGAKNTYTYDAGGHLTEFLIQTWDGAAWVNSSRTTSTYDGAGDETLAVQEAWDAYFNIWTLVTKDDYTYDGSHHRILSLQSMWVGTWWVTQKDTMIYSAGKLIEKVTETYLTSGRSRVQWTYNANGNEILELAQDWNETGSAWVNTSRTKSVWGGMSCCTGVTGNVNTTGIVDVSDLTLLVAYLTVTPPPSLPCPAEANVNTVGIIDVSDLTLLVSYLTIVPPPSLPSCP